VYIDALPESLRKLARQELAAGESVRWVERPTPDGRFPWASLIPVFFGIPWTAFSVFWTLGAAGVIGPGGFGEGPVSAGRLLFALPGVLMILAGVAMLTSPLRAMRRMRRAAENTVYVITDRRAIVFYGGYPGNALMAGMLLSLLRPQAKGVTIRSYPPGKLNDIERTQRDDGSGDVVFHEVMVTDQETGEKVPIARAGFFSVRNVRQVEEMLRGLARTAKEP